VTNSVGNVLVGGTATIGVGTGNVTINGSGTDIANIGLTAAGNVLLKNKNAVEFTTTNVSGTLSETAVGPIAATSSVQVAGAASFTANNGGFGYADPYINITAAGDHFGGGLTLSVPSPGGSGTGGYATIVDSGAIAITASNTATYLRVQAGGAVTTGPITAGSYLTVVSGGAVSLGTTNVGSNLSATSAGAITQTGALNIPQQTTLTAGSANNITLASATNQFGSVQVVSGNNVALVAGNAINFGSINNYTSAPSVVSGNFSVTAVGNISQTMYNCCDYSGITVSGNTTFTANNPSAQINLFLGTSNPSIPAQDPPTTSSVRSPWWQTTSTPGFQRSSCAT